MTYTRPRAWFWSLLLLSPLRSAHAEDAPRGTTGDSSVQGPEPPRAPPPPISDLLTGDAKRDYESARLLYDNGDYAGAAVKFHSAYERSRAENAKWEGDPRLLWNAASCEKSLHRYARAIALVRRYLDSRSPLVTPEGELAARAFLAAAEPLTAPVVIEANVPGALVYLDDELLGKTPLESSVRVDLGTHRLQVIKGDHTDYVETLSIGGSDEFRITAVLRPIARRGRLVVRAAPGDSIAIDGVLVGMGRVAMDVPSGVHSVRVTAPGSRPFDARVLVNERQARNLDVVLERPRPGDALPPWVWAAGGSVLTGILMTSGYFILKP
jgi:hypothetical protein